LGNYLGALSMLLVALAVVGGGYAVHRVVALDARPVKALPFLSGTQPSEHALSRFHARWYPATLLFLAFDVEMLFTRHNFTELPRIRSERPAFDLHYPEYTHRQHLARGRGSDDGNASAAARSDPERG
jgi:hypothetical protein